MAATDQTYRNQRTLDVVFGVSCVLMLLSILWMFVQDFNREYKTVQRDFRDVEEALNEHMMLEKLPSKEAVEEKRKAIKNARDELAAAKKKVESKERDLMAEHDTRDNKYREIKADFDSKTSLYNIAIEHYGKATGDARDRLDKEVQERKKELEKLQDDLAKAQDALDETDRKIKAMWRENLKEKEDNLAQAEDDLKKQTAAFDRFAKATVKTGWKAGDTFRALPILDAFESPTKIKQVWLPDLTIEYGSFKEVPRYDRCVSCHLGIDRANYDPETLRTLGSPQRHAEMVAKLKDAEKIFRERQREGENLGFDVSDLPSQRRTSIWLPSGVLFLAFVMIGVILGVVEQSARVGMGLTAVGFVVAVATAVGIAFLAPREPAVKEVKLSPGQVTQYAAHPRLDLFVDANSPHPMEKFGCTACHAGQGSATDFQQADHTPATFKQEEAWKKEYNWHADHFWDFPMLSSRFVESSCTKCHHQMTDLISHGSKEEAPKLLRGYNLVRENGCFGCHEIAGLKGGREVGPDLRLEPAPALEFLSPSEQDRARSDPLNPPGAFRRVGPSLRRIAEKTNQEWARKWIQAPRDFRPDTKMPHFYGLSNNTPDALPDDQKKFPATEIHAIAYYLFAESKGAVGGEDTTRKFLAKRLKELHGDLRKGLLEDRSRKELLEVTRRLADLMLISVPMKAPAINAAAGELRRLQDRVQELQKKKADLAAKPEAEDLPAAEAREMKEDGASLDTVTDRLLAAGKIVPLSQQLLGEDGTPVSLPKADAKDAAKGRRLFSEKGCLACHTHAGTAKAGDSLPGVTSQANFGPNLSRLAAKIAPEIADKKDLAEAKRRWVVQWVMNPNVYHPRTRMPITHLSAEDASAVAEWLLGQEVKDWTEADPATPTTEDLVALARLYLGKAPGMTRKDVDDSLPTTPGKEMGIPVEKLSNMVADADEQRLAGPITDDKLKWYIGRKAINRLGCFGCHDVPGFETAKPIGTALNDWGKKDPERLAFEDGDVFVRDKYNLVDARNNTKDPTKPAADWHARDGKPPFERFFYNALEHHQRQGFLHLKLEDPRSYDYHRIRTWDDRLRMPQFRFARLVRSEGEGDEEFHARQDLAEAEAREAVMTFILSLVGEAMPAKYLNRPGPDRLAEVKGRQVLEKFNCAGCHQVRSGVFEFKPSNDAVEQLEAAYKTASSSFREDYHFPGHNAWTGTPATSAERMLAYGTLPKVETVKDRSLLTVRLTDALRFTGNDGVVRDLPGGSVARLLPEETRTTTPFGGTFADLMVGYLTAKDPQQFKPNDPDDQNARSVLPPPLIREGERVQPNWLYGFLLNPTVIRPQSYMLLRMPKFNMSPEDARQLVDYFTSVSRLTNPGAGVSAQYVTVEQREPSYWKERTKGYVEGLKKDKVLEDRIKEMRPVWEVYLKRQVADAEAGLDAAKQAAKDTPEGEVRKQKEKELADREANIKKWKEQLDKKDYADLQKQWEADEAYAVDAFRSMMNRDLCMKCHSVGSVEIEGSKGPNLALSAGRLRPEWTLMWIANPTRLFPYEPQMPMNFPNNPEKLKSLKVPFVGTPLETVESIRDVLLDLPRLSEMPALRAPAGGGK
jgi:mono/diheme cytochrome c family protein/cbb3-type cytochrome oxidase cytochrome c subunit